MISKQERQELWRQRLIQRKRSPTEFRHLDRICATKRFLGSSTTQRLKSTGIVSPSHHTSSPSCHRSQVVTGKPTASAGPSCSRTVTTKGSTCSESVFERLSLSSRLTRPPAKPSASRVTVKPLSSRLEQLYSQGVRKQRARPMSEKQEKERREQERYRRELNECTFHPQTNTAQRKSQLIMQPTFKRRSPPKLKSVPLEISFTQQPFARIKQWHTPRRNRRSEEEDSKDFMLVSPPASEEKSTRLLGDRELCHLNHDDMSLDLMFVSLPDPFLDENTISVAPSANDYTLDLEDAPDENVPPVSGTPQARTVETLPKDTPPLVENMNKMNMLQDTPTRNTDTEMVSPDGHELSRSLASAADPNMPDVHSPPATSGAEVAVAENDAVDDDATDYGSI